MEVLEVAEGEYLGVCYRAIATLIRSSEMGAVCAAWKALRLAEHQLREA